MKKYIHITISLVLVLILFGCVSWQINYGRIKTIPESNVSVTIQDLIDKWDDYNIYYSDGYEEGSNARSALGVMFDPKNNDTILVGDRWHPVRDKKTLIEAIKWIYPTTQYEPRLNEILGPDGRFYGYLYYSYGGVVLKKIDDNKMYVLDLERPHEEGLGDEKK
jgi:hypothetical protein